MLQAAVLSLCVFPHNEDVYVLVPGHHSWQALTVDNIGIEV